MECITNKPGAQCKFMSQNGCKYLGGACFEIVEHSRRQSELQEGIKAKAIL
jgi:hypothetical protein